MKIKITKSGQFSFNGVKISEVAIGEIDMLDANAKQLVDAGWAEHIKVDTKEEGRTAQGDNEADSDIAADVNVKEVLKQKKPARSTKGKKQCK